jgi:hypothetical protein
MGSRKALTLNGPSAKGTSFSVGASPCTDSRHPDLPRRETGNTEPVMLPDSGDRLVSMGCSRIGRQSLVTENRVTGPGERVYRGCTRWSAWARPPVR